MIGVRGAVAASWLAAMRRAELQGAVILTPSSAAGMLLERHGGNANEAIAEAQTNAVHFGWWLRVCWTIEQIIQDEEASHAAH